MSEERKSLEATIRNLEVAALGRPDDIPTLRRLADAYASAGVFNEQSLDVYERVSSADSSRRDLREASAIARQLRNVAHIIRDSAMMRRAQPTGVDENIHLLRGWVQDKPESADLRKTLGDLYMMRGQFAEAAELYRAACSRGFQPVVSILETVQVLSGMTPVVGAPALYFGELAHDNGRDEMAERLLRVALETPDCSTQAALLLVDILERRRGRLRSEEERERLAWELARLRHRLDDIAGATAMLAELDIAAVGNEEFVRQLARALAESGDYRQAFDFLSRLPLDAESKIVMNDISVMLEGRGEIDTARFILGYIDENDPALKEARLFRERELEARTELQVGDLHRANGRFDMALDRYLAVLRLGCADKGEMAERVDAIVSDRPEDLSVETLTGIGQFYADSGDTSRAFDLLKRAFEVKADDDSVRRALRAVCDVRIADNPNLPDVRLCSGELFMLEREFSHAADEFRYAAQFPQTEHAAQRRLAKARLDGNELLRAVECYEKMALTETDLDGMIQLATRLESARQLQEAVKILRMTEEVQADYKNVKERIEVIEGELLAGDDAAQADPKMRELIGDQALGRYRYIEQIGSGGMGSVHKIYDIRESQLVAIKVLRDGLVSNTKAVDRFFREARIAATLNHRNIVRISDYSINRDLGRSFIVMELVDGPSLRDRIEDRLDSGHQVALEDIAEDMIYCSQLCDALEATHRKGIIHRDIKPDNVMLNSRHEVKITDFGIMHVEEATFTPTGALIGTPRYMSPEQVQGVKIDGRSDLYSVGIIMYELLVGSPPFVSGDIAYQQVHVQPTPPIEINPLIPEEVNAVILRALEKDRDLRSVSAHALKTEIDQVCDGVLRPLVNRLREEFSRAAESGD